MDCYDSDSPIELPNGHLACGRHGLVICSYCYVDYTELDDSDDSEGELERLMRLSLPRSTMANAQDFPTSDITEVVEWQPVADNQPHSNDIVGISRGIGTILPTKFTPPSESSTPAAVFPKGIASRFHRHDDPSQALIYAGGACVNNGQADPKAGWAFVFKSPSHEHTGVVSSRLENRGPFGDDCIQRSNRAELQAVVAALRYRCWDGEGIRTLVLATDSEYVAECATTQVRIWMLNGWKTSWGSAIENKDLWELLLGMVERMDGGGLKVQFWRIPRELNEAADHAAKQAAEKDEVLNNVTDFSGILV